MKIIILAHNARHDNGGGVFVSALANGALQNGHSVAIFTTVASGNQHGHVLRAGFLGFIKNIFFLRREIKKADIIHAFDIYPYGIMAFLASFGIKKPLIISAIGSGSILPLYRFGLKSMSSFVAKRASALTAISSFIKKEFLKKVSDVAIQIIYPGIHKSWLNAEAEKFAYPMFKPYLLTVGTLRWRKGYKISIPAFAKVREKFPDLHYVIIGKRHNDVMYKRIFDLIREYKLENTVHVLEAVDEAMELRALYQNAELFWLISQNSGHDVEGFGMVFLEAASQGLAVVGSRDCGVEDAMENGKNGFLVHEKNINEAADAVINILRDSQLKKRFSEESLRFVKNFSWDSKVAEYEALYKKLLQ